MRRPDSTFSAGTASLSTANGAARPLLGDQRPSCWKSSAACDEVRLAVELTSTGFCRCGGVVRDHAFLHGTTARFSALAAPLSGGIDRPVHVATGLLQRLLQSIMPHRCARAGCRRAFAVIAIFEKPRGSEATEGSLSLRQCQYKSQGIALKIAIPRHRFGILRLATRLGSRFASAPSAPFSAFTALSAFRTPSSPGPFRRAAIASGFWQGGGADDGGFFLSSSRPARATIRAVRVLPSPSSSRPGRRFAARFHDRVGDRLVIS